MKESKKWTNHKKEGKTSNTSSEKNKTNSRKETRGLHGSLPRRLKKMFFSEMLQEIVQELRQKKIQILSTRFKKKKRKRKTQPWNLNPKGRTPPFQASYKTVTRKFLKLPHRTKHSEPRT